MTILSSASGTLRILVGSGQTLVIRNYSGSESVSGSTALREDAAPQLGAGACVYGPQSSDALISLSTTGQLDYQVVAGDVTPSSPVQIKSPSNQLVTNDGKSVAQNADGINANTDDSATISNNRQIKASAGRVTNIVCTSGTSIALVLYDNAAAAASGRQIYSGTLSAGDVVNPADAWFDQGCFAQFTGTASFVINTSESAQ